MKNDKLQGNLSTRWALKLWIILTNCYVTQSVFWMSSKNCEQHSSPPTESTAHWVRRRRKPRAIQTTTTAITIVSLDLIPHLQISLIPIVGPNPMKLDSTSMHASLNLTSTRAPKAAQMHGNVDVTEGFSVHAWFPMSGIRRFLRLILKCAAPALWHQQPSQLSMRS